jgi:hypothetical protein
MEAGRHAGFFDEQSRQFGEELIMNTDNTFAVGDKVWLKNADGDPIMTGNTHSTRREVTFKVTSVTAGRHMIDTHNSEARRRYCGGIGYPADSLVKAV